MFLEDIGQDRLIPEGGKLSTILDCFSAVKNGEKLLSMKRSADSGDLACLHGIRFLSTCWVVIGHTWVYGASSNYVHNPNMVKEDGQSWWFQGIGNATVSVDTFLLMSGLLVSYLLLRQLDRTKGKVNVGILYLHRFLRLSTWTLLIWCLEILMATLFNRLTPVYAIVLAYVATLMVYVGNGPNWFRVEFASNGCDKAWWKHLLYSTQSLFKNSFIIYNNLFVMIAQLIICFLLTSTSRLEGHYWNDFTSSSNS